jgi:hypothetical protein
MPPKRADWNIVPELALAPSFIGTIGSAIVASSPQCPRKKQDRVHFWNPKIGSPSRYSHFGDKSYR